MLCIPALLWICTQDILLSYELCLRSTDADKITTRKNEIRFVRVLSTYNNLEFHVNLRTIQGDFFLSTHLLNLSVNLFIF